MHISRLRKILFIGFGALTLIGIQRFCAYQTDEFALVKIKSNLSFHPEWEVECAPPNAPLSQSYKYLGKGAQVFAFVSQDGNYVIKFFRHHKTRHPLEPINKFLPQKWRKRLMQTIKKRGEKRMKDFLSYKLAFNELREETGLLYLHLNKTDSLNTHLTLFDKIGVRHFVDLDHMEFLIQKKAKPLYTALETWIENGEEEKAMKALSSLVYLLKCRRAKGIFDKDPDLMTNFGVIGCDAIQFDIGRFKKETTTNTSVKEDADELIRITHKLSTWLKRCAPKLRMHLLFEVENP